MQNYRRFALATTAATYFLIFVGGLVRVAGAGLGCPDWPKCFGSWIPPTSLADLPPGIDPATFNVTLAWIEWTNRLVGVTVGFLILGVALLALKHFRRTPGVLWPSLAAAVLVAFQGWQGSVVVSSELQPFIVTIHMVLALLIVSLLIYAVLKSYAGSSGEKPAGQTSRLRLLTRVLWIGTIIQIILGSQIREAIETAAAQYPLWSGDQLFGAVGAMDDIHFIMAIALVGLTYGLVMMARRVTPPVSKLAKVTVQTLVVIVFLQSVTGVVLQTLGLPSLIDLFHLWLAALSVGLAMVLYVEISRPASDLAEQPFQLSRVLGVVAAAIVVLGVVGYFVTAQAEQSRRVLIDSKNNVEEGLQP